ncbi:MAG TPA: sugar ABC transporter permease [Aggregatilineales bacterium]|nr:sugar ABC transporter permease [Aggregatilineales bacterium]
MPRLLRLFGATPLARRRAYWGLALVAPNVLGLLFFFGIPVLVAFGTSLVRWNSIQPPVFVGLENFKRLVTDPDFGNALVTTFKLVLYTLPLELLFALGVALMLNQRLLGRSVFRTIYFLPVVTSTVAASIVWTWIFQPRYGLIGNLLAPLGLRDVAWLTRPDLVLIPIAAVAIWQRLGFDMVLFLAGLQNIPRIMYEAAVIDGAGRWAQFRRITIPLLTPTLFLVSVLSIIALFQLFDPIYIMTSRTTRGGVDGSATNLVFFLYQTGFIKSDFGYSSAIALALFLIILGFTVIQLRMQRRWVYYEAGDA